MGPGAAVLLLSLIAPPPATPLELHASALAAHARGDDRGALAALDRMAREHPDFYRANHHDYLAGVLAEQVGDRERARAALARVVGDGGVLAGRARVRLARLLAGDDPRQALALLAPLAGAGGGGAAEVDRRLLEVTLHGRLGRFAEADALRQRLPRRLRRSSDLSLLEIQVERGDVARARERARAILRGRTDDAAGAAAALVLAGQGTKGLPAAERFRVAQALTAQRRFGLAVDELAWLERGAEARLGAEASLLLGRAALKAGDDELAGRSFARIAGRKDLGQVASYQLARVALACSEREEAMRRFRAVADAPGRDRMSALALLRLVRLQADARDIEAARNTAHELRERFGASAQTASQAALVLAGVALADGDPRAALADLDAVTPAERDGRREVAYWRGVALTAAGDAGAAAAELRRAVSGSDLLSSLARERLRALGLDDLESETRVVQAAAALARGEAVRAAELAGDALERGIGGDLERRALDLLARAYRAQPRYQPIFELELPPPRPARMVGSDPPASAAEDLRFLGLDAEAASELQGLGDGDVAAVFRVAELARRGGNATLALTYGDRLRRRLPERLPPACLPPAVAALVYPDAFAPTVALAATRTGVDPDLVLAVMREESRYDPGAVSPAGARGLMQLIPETTGRVGGWLGLPGLGPESAHEPQVAIPLGAAYLSRLLGIFGGNVGAAVAAYNAGEETAFEWWSRSEGGHLDGLVREIEYDETRRYVDRVLTSLAAYRGRRAAEAN